MAIMHLGMDRDAKRLLDGMARRRFGRARGFRGETIRSAVLLMKYLSDRQAAGAEITVRDRKTGETKRLIMAPEEGGL